MSYQLNKAHQYTVVTLLLALAAAMVAGPAYSLHSDVNLPIQIEAESAEINESTGSSVYRGNVTVDQGTMRLHADEIKILTTGNRIVEIVASSEKGSDTLAHYEQQSESEEERVYADAREITYRVQEEVVQLSGDASLRQTQDLFRGELLKYDVRNGTVKLTGQSEGEEGESSRISISLTPLKK